MLNTPLSGAPLAACALYSASRPETVQTRLPIPLTARHRVMGVQAFSMHNLELKP